MNINKSKKSTREMMAEGPIMEWEQDEWWQEGKSRRKSEDKPFLKSPKGIAIIVGGLILFFVASMLIIQLSRNGSSDTEEVAQEELIHERGITPLQYQIKQLRSQLEAADPVIRDTPLPQVEMNITITEK